MKTPDQGALFDSLPLTPGVVQIVGSKAQLRPEQRSFNRLIEDIDKAKAELATWRAAIDTMAEQTQTLMAPALREKCAVIRELVIGIDFLISTPQQPRLGKVQRERLLALMSDLMLSLDLQDDPTLNEIHVRHYGYGLVDDKDRSGDIEFDAPAPGKQPPHDDPFEAETPEWEPGPARARRGDAAGDAGEGKRAEAAREASQSLRDTYRRLASLLHPDREPDPAERERKNQLMQQANQAYEARDLLTLLNMQLEVERFDPGRLAALPSERIRHYNQILKEQLQSVKEEIQSIIRVLADMAFPGSLQPPQTPDAYHRRFQDDLTEIQQLSAELRALAEGIQDPVRRTATRGALLQMTRPRKRRPADLIDLAEMDPEFIAAVEELMRDHMEGPRKRRRR